MPVPSNNAEIAYKAPHVDHITAYDKAHFTIYMRLLNAAADQVSEAEMARQILGIDAAEKPKVAKAMLRSHLDRARWIATTGYRHLFRETGPTDHDRKSR